LSNIAVVLDTSAIIRGFELLMRDNLLKNVVGSEKLFLFTAPAVIEEAKYSGTKVKLKLLLSRVTVLNVGKKYLKLAREAASKMGLQQELSDTDLEVLALALELMNRYTKVYVATDDIRLQNVCISVGLDVIAFKRRLRYLLRRRKKCMFCGIEFDNKFEECPNCGSKKFKYIVHKVKIR